MNRREFIKKSGYVSAIASGITLTSFVSAKADKNKRWSMLIDTNKCADNCNLCVVACAEENGWGNDEKSNTAQKPVWIKKLKVEDRVTKKQSNVIMMCQHCEKPPCVDVCPTNASMKRDDGIVLVDKHRCIGCRYCMIACPYDARSFVHENITNQKSHMPRGKGTVEACTMCAHRIDKEDIPACVSACNKSGNNAILFGDMNDSKSDIYKALKTYQSSQIRADLNLNTGVRYSGL